MRSPMAGLVAASLVTTALATTAVGCAPTDDGIGDPVAGAVGTGAETAPPEPPPTIDARELMGDDHRVVLPQLTGLSEADARAWAEQSGFVTVQLDDEPPDPDGSAVGQRLILTLDDDGLVSGAVSG